MSLQKIVDYTKANQESNGQPFVCLTYVLYRKVWVAELLTAMGIPVLIIEHSDPLVALELLDSSACLMTTSESGRNGAVKEAS
jgi:hypothetical protein